MELTVVDWNLNGATSVEPKIELLTALAETDPGWDVALLQEITREHWPALYGAFAQSGADVSFEHLPPLCGRPPKYHAGVLARGDWSFTSEGVWRDLPSPERSLIGTVRNGDHGFRVASLAVPPGVSWGPAVKCRQVARFAHLLAGRDLPTLVGIDANTPRFERLDHEQTVWWQACEPLLLGTGTQRAHDVRDTYRDWLDQDPSRWEPLRSEQPDGPLAVSYRRDGQPARYDYVLTSPEFDVLGVDYLMEEAETARSDHALVRVQLSLRGG